MTVLIPSIYAAVETGELAYQKKMSNSSKTKSQTPGICSGIREIPNTPGKEKGRQQNNCLGMFLPHIN